MTRAVIAGIGRTRYARGIASSAWELALEAITAALADAQLAPGDVDGMCRFSAPFEQVSLPQIVRALNVRELAFFTESPLGGEAVGGVLGAAAAAVESGRADVVVVYRSMSQSTAGRFGRADNGVDGASGDQIVPDEDNLAFAWPYGLMSPGHQFALQASRYAHDRRIREDQLVDALATVALTQRAYANANPHAMMRERTMSRDDYESARMISRPLRLFDYCLENDGAVAVVVTSSERAAHGRPVRILSTSQSLTPYQEPLGLYQEDLDQPFPAAAADRLYARAGLGPERVRVAELYDACTLMPLRSLEAYRLVPPGEGWRRAVEEGIGPGSPLPVNTHGGHLSEGYIHGMNAVFEAVLQLRGEASTQIPGADVALVGAPAGGAAILAA